MQQFPARFENFDPATMTICCVPSMCHVGEPIMLENLSDTVKVICNNESCMEGEYMHKVCFEQWEYTVLTYLRSTGRARSWSEKQRLQNLWTKKGYDLAYKACSCKCGKGHLRKDLDWIPPAPRREDQGKKKKHRKRKNDKPTLSITGNATVSRHTVSTGQQVPVNRIRSSSMSSMSSTSGSPPNFTGLETLDLSNNYGKSSVKVMHGMTLIPNSVTGFVYGRERPLNYNMFSRRQDYSSFNTLPRNKINSYHIKTDNEADLYDERDFIFPTLCARKIVGVNCIFCSSHMIIFDRYPLIDGTFFISPQQYSNSSISLTLASGEQFLNAICMSCLEGWNSILVCKFCQSTWNGSDLILGTVYSYDVIAAIPCCEERLKCNSCHIVLPQRRVQFFSDYSRSFLCPNCHVDDYHFVKPVSTFTLKSNSR